MGEQRDPLALHKDGSEVPVEVGLAPITAKQQPLVLCTVVDPTERKRLEARLRHQAYYGDLTGLSNRARARQVLDSMIDGQASGAVLYVDLDHFKDINDSCGPATGDTVVAKVAARLSNAVRDAVWVARLGGDEFLVIAENVSGAATARRFAYKMQDGLASPMGATSRTLYVRASIGVNLFPRDGKSAQELLRNADTAAYTAKAEGRNRLAFYESHLTNAA
jgi:diguanylate cyclase (GGDEF)-like protein